MQLDIRIPIGSLFTILGLLLAGTGLVADASANARALGHNVNLVWGIVMIAVGVLFLVLARRGGAGVRPPA